MKSLLDARADRLHEASSTSSDLLVVGGGINGVGIALDAASRGLSTVLVEKEDLSVGTSSRSSKLIHGGLRYLEHYQFGLVREALAERHLLATSIAPHLVHFERFLFPIYGRPWEVPYVGAGLTVYDGLGSYRAGRFRFVRSTETQKTASALSTHGLRAAFEYRDGVVDDARYVVAVARTAARLGASLLTRCEAVEWIRTEGRVVGAVIRDSITGETVRLHARAVVDATGAFEADSWTDTTTETHLLRPSRGIHLVVPRSRITSEVGLTVRVPGRVVFIIPHSTHWLIGTTDVVHEGPIDRPVATSEEVEYLLDSASRVLNTKLEPDDIVATYAGIRPLVGTSAKTEAISREELIDEREPGLFTVRGGKYTTYRRVAARAVDLASQSLGRFTPSPTARIPLIGALPPHALDRLADRVAGETGIALVSARHLVGRYGTEALEVASLAVANGLDTPLVAGLPYLVIEAWWAVHREHALSVDDVLARRTRVAIEDPDHGASAAETVAQILGEALAWTSSKRSLEVGEYVRSATSEYGVPSLMDGREVMA
jgi:glycerol-3-phosphate dehydrogenase